MRSQNSSRNFGIDAVVVVAVVVVEHNPCREDLIRIQSGKYVCVKNE